MNDLLHYKITRTLTQIEAASDDAERVGASHWVRELAEWREVIEAARARRRLGTATNDELQAMLAGALSLVDHITAALSDDSSTGSR